MLLDRLFEARAYSYVNDDKAVLLLRLLNQVDTTNCIDHLSSVND